MLPEARLLVSTQSHAAFSATVASEQGQRRISETNLPERVEGTHDRRSGCQPFVITGAVQRRQHRSERMAAMRCYSAASRSSPSFLFLAESPGRE